VRAITSLVAVLGALLITRAASAQAPADTPAGSRAEAKRLSDLGRAAMDRRDFAVAADDFERAHEIFPSPNLLYNLGVARDQLGRSVDAFDTFTAFLETVHGGHEAERDYARARHDALETLVAHLELAAPPDAELTVDGKAVASPRAGSVTVAPGKRTVVATKEGRAPLTMIVSVVAGEHRRVELIVPSERAPRREDRSLDGLLITPASLFIARPSPSLFASPSRERRRHGERVAALALALGGVAVLGGGLAAGIVAQRAGDTLTHNAQLGRPFDPGLQREGKAAQVAEGPLLGIGAAAAVTSVVLYLVARGEQGRAGAGR
jgi:hypothetical protein